MEPVSLLWESILGCFLTEKFARCKDKFALVGFYLDSANSTVIQAPVNLAKTAYSHVLGAPWNIRRKVASSTSWVTPEAVLSVIRCSNSSRTNRKVLACFTCGEEKDGFWQVVSFCVSVQAVLKMWAETKMGQVILDPWLSWEACCAYSTKKPPRSFQLYLELIQTTSFHLGTTNETFCLILKWQ